MRHEATEPRSGVIDRAVDEDDDAVITERHLCPSCRAQALIRSDAESRGYIVTFVSLATGAYPWTCFVRQGESVVAYASGETQEASLVDALLAAGVIQ